MKRINTVVEEWPTKPIVQLGQMEAQKEFDILLGSNHSCIERLVEWRRTIIVEHLPFHVRRV